MEETEKAEKKKKNTKSLQIYFNLDDELEREIYDAIMTTKIVGMTTQGLAKKLFYDALIGSKQNNTISPDITIVQPKNPEQKNENKSNAKSFVDNFKRNL